MKPPPCMDDGEWGIWCATNAQCGQAKATTPCVDCTRAFRSEMRSEGRCEPQRARAMSKAEIAQQYRFRNGQLTTLEEHRRAIAKRQQRAVRLRACGLTLRQIAAQLGCTYNTVWQDLRRAAA